MTHAMHVLAASEPGLLFVALMGMGIVFIGLICIILICTLMGAVCTRFAAKESEQPAQPASAPVSAAPAPAASAAAIPNRTEMLAAVTAVIAEELGTDVSAIRVHSFKRIG